MTYRIAATLQLVFFFFIAVFAFKPKDYMPNNWETDSSFPDNKTWPEFFHMPVLMLILITLLNDGTLIAIGYDNAIPRQEPEKWNLSGLYLISTGLAAVSCLSSLLLLWFLLDSWKSGGVFHGMTLPGLSYGQVTTSIYLKISVADFLTLFAARTGKHPFWASRPATILILAGGFSLTISTILSITWPSSYPDGIYTLGLGYRKPYGLVVYIWIYCLIWWFIQDGLKILTFYVLEKYNLFGWNDTGKMVLPESTVRYIKKNKDHDMQLGQ
jgi:H+-transporting ATPase